MRQLWNSIPSSSFCSEKPSMHRSFNSNPSKTSFIYPTTSSLSSYGSAPYTYPNTSTPYNSSSSRSQPEVIDPSLYSKYPTSSPNQPTSGPVTIHARNPQSIRSNVVPTSIQHQYLSRTSEFSTPRSAPHPYPLPGIQTSHTHNYPQGALQYPQSQQTEAVYQNGADLDYSVDNSSLGSVHESSPTDTASQQALSAEPERKKWFLRRSKGGPTYTVCAKQPYKCLWENCDIVKEKACLIKEHYLTDHALFNCIQCNDCGNSYARPCTYKRHLKNNVCPKKRPLTPEQRAQGKLRNQIMDYFRNMMDDGRVRLGIKLIKECNMNPKMWKRKRATVNDRRKVKRPDAQDQVEGEYESRDANQLPDLSMNHDVSHYGPVDVGQSFTTQFMTMTDFPYYNQAGFQLDSYQGQTWSNDNDD